MSNQHFDSNLDNVLTLLNKKAWALPLTELEQKFRLLPKDATAFGDELLNSLWSLHDATKTDNELPLTHLFAVRLSKFEAWTFRFSISKNQVRHYLNPLTQDTSELIHAEVSQSGTAFPAEDIIKRWARDYLV